MHSALFPEFPGSEGERPPGVAAGAAPGGAGRGLGRGGGAVWCALSPAIQRVRSVPPVSHPGDYSNNYDDNDDYYDHDDNDASLRPAS